MTQTTRLAERGSPSGFSLEGAATPQGCPVLGRSDGSRIGGLSLLGGGPSPSASTRQSVPRNTRGDRQGPGPTLSRSGLCHCPARPLLPRAPPPRVTGPTAPRHGATVVWKNVRHDAHPGQGHGRRTRRPLERRLGGAGNLPLRPRARRASRTSRSTLPRPPSRAPSTSATSSATPTRTSSPATAACAGANVFYPMGWDDNGLPTERRVQNYFGVRCDPSLPYVEGFEPPHSGGDGKSTKAADQLPISRRNFIELCEVLTAEDEKQFESLWRHLGLSRRLVAHLPDHLPRGPGRRAAGVPAEPRARRGVSGRGADAVGRDVPDGRRAGRARGPRHDGRVPPARVPAQLPRRRGWFKRRRLHRDDAPRAPRRVRRPGRAPRRRAVPAAVRHHRPHAAVRRRGARRCALPRGPRQGLRHRHDLHVRRHHRRHVVARAPARDPADARLGRARAARAAAGDRDRGRARGVRGDRGDDRLQRAEARRGDAPRVRRHGRRAHAHPAPRQVLREGRQAPRDHHDPPVVHRATAARTRRSTSALVARGTELGFEPDFMRVRYENWVKGLQGDWLISRQRFFGVPIPVWYPLDDAGNPVWDAPIVPTEDALPVDPSSLAAPGYDESRRGVPGGFVGEKDIMDTWATSSLTPQIACGWRDRPRALRRDLPHGPASPGPGHHPHVAVLHRRPFAPRARDASLEARGDLRLDPRPRPQEDVQVRRQRRDARGPAPRAWARRRAVLGGVGAARDGRGVRHRADEDRAAPRDQGAQRVEVRARRDGDRGRGQRVAGGRDRGGRARDRRGRDRGARPGDARGARRGGGRRDGGVRGVRPHARARGGRSRSSGRSPTTTSS